MLPQEWWGAVSTWIVFELIAAVLAAVASLPSLRKGKWRWALDFVGKWGLAGLFVYFIATTLWATREFAAQSYLVSLGPLWGMVEYSNLVGAVLSGLLSLSFFGTTLFIQALFAEWLEEPQPKLRIRYSAIAVGDKIARKMEVEVGAPEAEQAGQQQTEEQKTTEEKVIAILRGD